MPDVLAQRCARCCSFAVLIRICSLWLVVAFRSHVSTDSQTDGWHVDQPAEGITSPLLKGMTMQPGDIDYHGIGSCSTFGQRLLKKTLGIIPEQVHLTYWTSTSILVSWAVGDTLLGPVVPAWSPTAVQAVVQFGTQPDRMDRNATGSSNNVVYQRKHTSKAEWGLTYSSPILCHVLLLDLTPGQRYWYRVGDPDYHAWSAVFSFRQLPAGGSKHHRPLRLALIGDLSTSKYTAINVDNILEAQPDVVLLLGDLAYSDMYQDNGTMKFAEMPASAVSEKLGQDQPGPTNNQPRWDAFGRLLEPLLSTVPMLSVMGNHELEPEEGDEPVAINRAYNARYPMPAQPSSAQLPTAPNHGGDARLRTGSVNAWYGVSLPGLYFIALSHYFDYSTTSEQYQWFQRTLSSVRRSVHPWIIVAHHVPHYNTLISHYAEGECFRKIFEPLYTKYGVDFVLTGHAHGYERTFPVADYRLDACGYIHAQIGGGGQDAKAAYVDGPSRPAYCSNASAFYVSPEMWYPAYKTDQDPAADMCRVPPVSQPVCPEEQPFWSAFRTPTYGFVSLMLSDQDTAEWEYVAAVQGCEMSMDKSVFRRPSRCKNRS